jgi:hypothetical protein
LDGKTTIGDQSGALWRHQEGAGFSRESRKVIQICGTGNEQAIKMRFLEGYCQSATAAMEKCGHKGNEETIVSSFGPSIERMDSELTPG